MTTFNICHFLFDKFSRLTLIWLGIVLLLSNSCKKMIQVPAPSTSINSANIFASDATAIGAVSFLYTGSRPEIDAFYIKAGLLADELKLYDLAGGGDYTLYYQNALTSTTSTNPWGEIYSYIFMANSSIQGINSSTSLTPSVKQQLLGEAKFMRAYFYFYLVNMFGDVPLTLTTDPEVNRLLSRSPKKDVYAQIENDLKESQAVLSKNFLSGNLSSTTTERVRPTYWAATALLARVYLYEKKYAEAIIQSSSLISNSAQFSLPSLNNAFLMNSSETIWALQQSPSGPPFNTPDGATLVLPSSGPGNDPVSGVSYPFYLSENVVNAFEKGDGRATSWVGTVSIGPTMYAYANKYKAGYNQVSVTEYEIVLRLGEQYLIRAEANARLGGATNIANAVADLNVIRTRARAMATAAIPSPLPNLSINLNQIQLFKALEHERQVELFTEFGHRWLDLCRIPGLNNPSITLGDEVMPAITKEKGGYWNPNWKLLPIPRSQISQDPNMTNAQNPGY